MVTIKNIELELKSICNSYNNDFITECQTSETIKNIFDEGMLLKKFQAKLEKELIDTVSNSSIDMKDWNKFEVIIRAGLIDLENIFRNSKSQ